MEGLRATDHQSQLRTFRDVASLINSSSDLDTILQRLVYAACRHAAWSMGGVMSIDEATGFAHVVARHDPALLKSMLEDRWKLSASPTLIALTRNEPVVIRDAQISEEFPGYKREAIERGYRTVVVLPMGCRDAEGRAMVLSLQSRRIVEVTEDDLAFLQTIVHLGAIAVDKASRLDKERRFAERLQAVLDAHTALMQQVLADGSVVSASAMIGELLPNPLIVVDLGANLVVAGRSPQPELLDDEAWQRAVRGELARHLVEASRMAVEHPRAEAWPLSLQAAGASLRLSAKIETLAVDDEAVGALIVFPHAGDFGDLDHLLLDSAKFALSVQMMRSYIRFRSESQTLSELFAEIVDRRWRDKDDLLVRARRVGLDLASPARLVAIGFPEGKTEAKTAAHELHRSIVRIARQHSPAATVAVLEDLTLCRMPEDGEAGEGRLKPLLRRIAEEGRWICGDRPIIAMSKRCEGLEDHPAAWDECKRILRLARRFDRRGLVTAQNFGHLPALLSAADTREVRAFVESAIGSVLAHDGANGTAYIETLSHFLDHGCRHQACADALGLHVTTLRYRLTRLRELFGIDIDTPERRFALELAIRLHAALAEDA
jgi:purine catabolism regulator